MSDGVHGELNGCPPAGALDAIARGEPSADAAVAAHVETCLTCARFVEEVRKNTEFLRGVAVAHLAGTATHSPATRRARAGARGAGSPARGIEEIGGYRLVKEIGRGGQGVIYEAVQEDTKRKVAIKMLLLGRTSERQRIRFEREAEIAGSLRHPGLVTIYETVQLSDGRRAMVMEFVEGQRLDRWVEGCRPRGPIGRETSRRLVAVMAEVCDAVDHAHRHGVIHRDLKPGNIVVGDGDQPRVLDFGLARRGERGEEAMLTRTGAFEGTPAYSSPEQVTGDPDLVDSRTDVYTLGVILYELLTGRLPYPVEGALIDVVKSITEAAPVRPGRIDEELWTIVVKAMAKERERRYQSAGDLREDLRRYLAGEAINAKRDSTWYLLRKTTSKHRWAVAAAGSALVLGIAALVKLAILTADLGEERTNLSKANARLTGQRDALEEALDTSRIANARAMASQGDNARAERALHERLAQLAGRASRVVTTAYGGNLGQKRAAWALAEIGARQVCLGTARAPTGGRSTIENRRAGGGQEFLFFEPTSGEVAIVSWRPPLVVSRDPQSIAGDFSVVAAQRGTPFLVRDGKLAGMLELHESRLVETIPLELACWQEDPVWNCAKLPGGQILVVHRSGSVRVHAGDGSSRELQPGHLHRGMHTVWPIAEGRECWVLSGDEKAVERVDTLSGAVYERIELPSRLQQRDLLTDYNQSSNVGIVVSADGSTMLVYAKGMFFFRSMGSPDADWSEPVGRDDGVSGCRLSADGSVAAVNCKYNGATRIWDLRSGRMLRDFQGHEVPLGGLALAEDGETVLVADMSGLLRLYATRRDVWRERIGVPDDGVPSIASIAGGVICGDDLGQISRIDANGQVHPLTQLDGAVTGLCVNATGSVLGAATLSGDMLLGRFDGERLVGIQRWRGDERKVTCAALSPDGSLFCTAGEKGPITLWDVATRERVATIRGDAAGVARAPFVTFSPDGTRLAWSEGAKVFVRNNVRGEIVLALSGHQAQVRVGRFSRDGRHLATGGDDRMVCVWDLSNGECVQKFAGSREKISAVAFGPDDGILYSGDFSSELRVWDVASGTDLAAFEAGGGIVFGIEPVGDGTRVAVATQLANAQVWDFGRLFQMVEDCRVGLLAAEPAK